MRYIHAVLLLHEAGTPINKKSIIKVLSAVGIKPDLPRIKVLVDSLSNVDIGEHIKVKLPTKPKPIVKPKQKPIEKKKEKQYGLGNLF